MKNLSKNNPILSRILPVFLLASMTLSSLQVNSMDRDLGIVAGMDRDLGIAAGAVAVGLVVNSVIARVINGETTRTDTDEFHDLVGITAAASLGVSSVMARVINGEFTRTNAAIALGPLAVACIYYRYCKKQDYIKKQNNALHVAAASNDIATVRQLLTAGADVNTKKSNDHTALMLAASNGHTEICRLLITADADVNTKKSNDHTALMLAASNGHTEICRLLITADADVNAKDSNGHTALRFAASNDHTDICRLLITAGAEISDDLRTHRQILAIPEAIRNQSPLIRTLTSPYPKRAGHLITLANINELLRTHDINSYIGDPVEQTTLLMLVAERGTSPETPAIIAELIRRGANVNAQDSYGRTALHRVFTVLHQQYKWVNITNASGEIVVLALGCGIDRSPEVTAQIVKQLLDSGIDVFIKDTGLEEDWNPEQEPGWGRSAFTYAGVITPDTRALFIAAGALYESRPEWEQAKARGIAKAEAGRERVAHKCRPEYYY